MATFTDKKNVSNNWVGSKQADTFFGGGGDDVIHGGGGDDRLYGDAGRDSLYGDDGHDSIYGGGGNDQLFGGAGNDDLRGEDGDDILDGGAGIDGLVGGLGSDILTGGGGSWDEFDYLSLADSSALGGIDRITDYNRVEGDVVMFLMLDANAAAAGLQGWTYVAGDAANATFDSVNGQATLIYDSAANCTTLNLYNNDGDLNADFTLVFNGQYGAGDIQISVLANNGAPPTDAVLW